MSQEVTALRSEIEALKSQLAMKQMRIDHLEEALAISIDRNIGLDKKSPQIFCRNDLASWRRLYQPVSSSPLQWSSYYD